MVAIFLSSIMIYSLFAYMSVNPKQDEQFFAVSLLGPNLEASEYYPTEEGIIQVGENVTWFIKVSSYTGSIRLLKLTVDVGVPAESSTSSFPENNESGLLQYQRVMREGETWLLPLEWIVTSAYIEPEGKIAICAIFNGIVPPRDILPQDGGTFRFIIGLWNFESITQSYELISWLQIWFTVPDPVVEGEEEDCRQSL